MCLNGRDVPRKSPARQGEDKIVDVQVKLVDGVTWMVSGPSGHGVVLDGAPEIGGRNLGMRPMEMVLAGLGGCTAMDVITVLRKQRQDVVDCVIELSAERADSPPKVFTRIEVHYRVFGKNLKSSAVERAVRLSMETYCSVSKMLKATSDITYRFECIEV